MKNCLRSTYHLRKRIKPMSDDILQDKVNKIVLDACDVFRGTVDPSVYKEFILTMLFLKYISDIYNTFESYRTHRAIPFIIPPGSGFDSLYENRHSPGNGERIDTALRMIEDANIDKLKDVFKDISFNSTKLGDNKQKDAVLYRLLEAFHHADLTFKYHNAKHIDILGNAYEFLINKFSTVLRKKAGEYYTPPEISRMIVRLVDPKLTEDICDPTCGSGSLLIQCAKYIGEQTGDNSNRLFGQESMRSTWALAKMNMFIHGEYGHQIEWGDTLRNPKLLGAFGSLRVFDVIVANPPFSLNAWGHEIAKDDPFSRFHRGIPPKTKGDYAFILHMIRTLKANTAGRICVVVPHGVLFRAASEGKIRRKLIEDNLLDTVIGLPENLFYGTSIPVAVLIFKAHKTDNSVLFIDASREYKRGKDQNFLDTEHVDKIVKTYKERKFVDKYAYLSTFEEIKENDFNLNIPRYVDTFEEEEEIDLMAVRAEREKLKQELAALEIKMDGYLKELGYDS